MVEGWFTKKDLEDYVDELRRTVLDARSQYDKFDWAMGMAMVVPSDQTVLPIQTLLNVQEITDGGVPDFQKPGMFKKFVIDVREFATALGITRQTIEDAEGWDPVNQLAMMAMISMKKKKNDMIMEALMDSATLDDFYAPAYGYFAGDANHDHWALTGTDYGSSSITIDIINDAIAHVTQHGTAKPNAILCNAYGMNTLLKLLTATEVSQYPATSLVIGGVELLSRAQICGLAILENEFIADGQFLIVDTRTKPVITRVKRDITLDTPPDDFGLTKSYYSLRMGALLAYPESVFVIEEDAAPAP